MLIDLNHTIFTILLGMVFVTIIDTAGSILSRKFKFRYEWFSILSTIAYTWVSYTVSQYSNNMKAISAVIVVGFFDAIIGWEIAQKLQANYGQSKETLDKATLPLRLIGVAIYALICGGIGIWFAGI